MLGGKHCEMREHFKLVLSINYLLVSKVFARWGWKNSYLTKGTNSFPITHDSQEFFKMNINYLMLGLYTAILNPHSPLECTAESPGRHRSEFNTGESTHLKYGQMDEEKGNRTALWMPEFLSLFLLSDCTYNVISKSMLQPPFHLYHTDCRALS